MSDKYEAALSLVLELSPAEKEQLLAQMAVALRGNKVEEQPKSRILGLHAHLGEGWMSEDFKNELPDEFWLGQE